MDAATPPRRPADPARAVLDAADELFYERGIGGVGMAEVRDASGVSLRRLYQLHASKHALVAAWLHDRHERWMRWFTAAVERRTANGSDATVAVFDALREWAASPRYRGCAFINAVAEVSEIDDEHLVIVAAHTRELLDYLSSMVLRDHPDAPEWMAAAIAVLVDGAIVQAVIVGNDAPIVAAREAAQRLVG